MSAFRRWKSKIIVKKRIRQCIFKIIAKKTESIRIFFQDLYLIEESYAFFCQHLFPLWTFSKNFIFFYKLTMLSFYEVQTKKNLHRRKIMLILIAQQKGNISRKVSIKKILYVHYCLVRSNNFFLGKSHARNTSKM